MSTCNIDHSNHDVSSKLESQRNFMPTALYESVKAYLQQNPDQEELNTLFHLLKKYDLVSAEEREDRNRGMIQVMKPNT